MQNALHDRRERFRLGLDQLIARPALHNVGKRLFIVRVFDRAQ